MAGPLRVTTVVGARPQFIKAAMFSRLVRMRYPGRIHERLVHTGQHYDDDMSGVFFREMGIPEPDINLRVGSGPHGRMTGEMLTRVEEDLTAHRPGAVLVYGDTNSTLAGALAGAKMGIPVAHVEAGLRSFLRTMPEEQNRILTDHLATLLFCPTETARSNLAREGIVGGVHVVGDIMLDAALHYARVARARPPEETARARLDIKGDYVLLTLHRAENTDDPVRLGAIVDALNETSNITFIFPVHPRTRRALAEAGIKLGSHVHLEEPVGYLDMLELEESSRLVVTDSGGVQKEAWFLHRPCITLRDQTEWVETVEAGGNILTGADKSAIVAALESPPAPSQWPPIFGDGQTADAILTILGGSYSYA